MLIMSPQLNMKKSERQRCDLGLNLEPAGGKRLDFRKNPKKAVRQAAQKTESKVKLRLSKDFKRRRMSGEIGSFLLTVNPLSLDTPFNKLSKKETSFP